MENEKMTVTLDTEDMRTVLASVGFVVCDWAEKARDEKAGKAAFVFDYAFQTLTAAHAVLFGSKRLFLNFRRIPDHLFYLQSRILRASLQFLLRR